MATFSSGVKRAQGSAISLSSARYFKSEVDLSPVVSPSAVRGNVRLNGELVVGGEAVSLSAVSAPNEAAIHAGGVGSAISSSAVKGNVRLNGELTISPQSAVSVSAVSGRWAQTDNDFAPMSSVASEGSYAQANATLEPLDATGEVTLEAVEPARGEASFAFMNGNATGVHTGPSLSPSESEMEPMVSVASEGSYAQAEGSFGYMRSFGVYELAQFYGADLVAPAGTLTAQGYSVRGEARLEQPAGTVTGNFGGIARFTQPLGVLTLDATINVYGRARLTQPRSTLDASGISGSIGRARLEQPRSTLNGGDGWRIDLVSPGHALAIDATMGAVGTAELSQPRTVLTAKGSEANTGQAELVQPAGSLGVAGLILLEQPSAQLAASGGEQVTQYVYAAYAVNLAHAGVTEFTDYPFRRIVEFNGEYYGVGPQGVFRIEGNQDDGAAIKAIIETGRPDFGSSLYKRVTYTYLLMDTADVLHVSPITGEGDTHRRKALGSTQKGTHTRRVQFGRGLKARNWGIRIEHEGGDRFTLQDIEMVGEVLSRKVGG